MRILYHMVSVWLCASVAFISEACSSYLHTYLVYNRIKPNPTVKSKPTYPRYANVTFITDDTKRINFGCPYGWYMSDGKCLPNPCNGFPYINTDQLKNCMSYESCKSGDTFKYRCSGCKPNMVNNGGSCICPRDVYPKSLENGCVYEFDTSNKCTEIKSDGLYYDYYAGCLCPSEWNACDGSHQAGLGTACESYGKVSYYNCGCEAGFNKSCVDGAPVNAGDYCLNLSDATRYYDECYYCDINKGEVYSYEDYWCDHEWVNFPPVKDLFTGNEGEPEDCSAYTLAANECDPGAGECSYCYGNGLWKYDSCFEGWTMTDGKCAANACEGYPSLTSALRGCAAISSCRQGDTIKYACEVCGADYNLSEGICTDSCPYYVSYKSSGCAEMASCERSGKTYYSDKCLACHTGFTLSGNGCQQTCSYISASKEHCTSYESCDRGSDDGVQTYYQCSACEAGYYLSPYDTTCLSCVDGKEGARTDTPYSDTECAGVATDKAAQEIEACKNNNGGSDDKGGTTGGNGTGAQDCDAITAKAMTAAEIECGGITYYYCTYINQDDTSGK